MPIRPENKARYPEDWPEISRRIREDRAKGMCECRGECGSSHLVDPPDDAWEAWLANPAYAEVEKGRCPALNGRSHPVTGSRVVLTVAHRDHTPEHCDDDNLFAACQRCHLGYDREHHAETRAANRTAALEAGGQLTIGEL